MAELRGSLDHVWKELQELGLEKHVADLDAHGFTIIPPALAGPEDLSVRLLEATLDVGEKRNGDRPDLEKGTTHAGFRGRFAGPKGDSPVGEMMQCLLFEDRVYEEALMNPVLLAMATYLCGYSTVLSSMGCFMKGPNETSFGLHCDNQMVAPFQAQAAVCNITYVLTDFTRDNGSTAFVPGSHRWCRPPDPSEAKVGGPNGNPQAIAVEAEAGSLIVWHGNTWHGAFNRRTEGLRVSIPVLMARPYMRTEEHLIGKIPQEMLERNSARFAVLTQQGISYSYEPRQTAVESEMARGDRVRKYMGAYAREMGDLHAAGDPGHQFS